jgi:ubiquinone/menaquinone biosynthesis C-methylase UbiE
MREIYWFNFKLSLLHKITGVGISRCFEYPLAVINLSIQEGEKLLEIGSGKSCFPLFMVKRRGVNTTVLDIDERVIVQKKYAKKVGILNHVITERFNVLDDPKTKTQDKSFTSNDGSFSIIVSDARKINFPDSSFDAVSCISVIEHIPNNGDLLAIKEIARVLKPKGRAFISVPYGQKYEEGKTLGGHFERRYDYEALNARLIQPSGLKLKKIGFVVFDQRSRKLQNLYYKLPKYVRYVLGWSCIFLALLIPLRDNANRDNAEFPYIVLEKS